MPGTPPAGPTISTEPLGPADLPWVWEVYQATTRAQDDLVLGPDEEAHRRRRRDELAAGCFEAVLVDGCRVGVIEVREGEDALDVRHLEVLPAHQRGGIGSAVVALVARRAAARGKDVSLRVLHVNPRARALYERLGFVVEEERDRSTQMRLVISR